MPDVSHPAARARRAWRIVFVIYALALTTGTHWPRLQLGTPEMPAPDKLIHLVAFGGLALLLWRSGWLRGAGAFLIIAGSWVLLDELSQSIPALGRTISWEDALAGVLGVLIVMLWRSALDPVGGPGSRARRAFALLVFDDLVARPATWLRATAAALLGGGLLACILWFVARMRRLDELSVCLLAGGVAGAHFSVTAAFRRRRAELAPVRPCLECGASCAGVIFDAGGVASCRACGTPQWIGQWRERLGIPRRRLLRLVLLPTGLRLAAVAVAVLPIAAAATTLPHLGTALVVTLAALMAADGVRLARERIGLLLDAQHLRCVRCGHDVHASPTNGGGGQCSECGQTYHVPPPWPPTRSKHTLAPSRS